MNKQQLEEIKELSDRIKELIYLDQKGTDTIYETYWRFYNEISKNLKDIIWEEYKINKEKDLVEKENEK